jgi:uncharacterized protein YecT (DUF1311 family)
MNLRWLAGFCALLVLPSSPLYAIDCAKASTPVAALICATPELKKADDEMSTAYFKLLRETTDPDFHNALIRSQLRWLKARETGPQRFGAAEGDTTDDRKVLRDMTNSRSSFLQKGEPIRRMEWQRKLVSKDGGGAFAGYSVGCSLLPPPYGGWSYECWGDLHRQHNDRVCSSIAMWASGHLTDYRLVRLMRGRNLEVSATCSIGYASTTEPCPSRDSPSPDAHWNITPGPLPDWLLGGMKELWKFDPDVPEFEDVSNKEWMNECLFSPVYPSPNESRSDK